jgi:hypothetical protein
MTTGRLCLDAVPQALGHVNQGARPDLQRVVAQCHLRLALEEVQDGGRRGGVFGKLLALRKAEGDRLEPVVGLQRAAQYALVGWLNLLCQIEEESVLAHAG